MILEQFDKCKLSTFNPSDVVKKIENMPRVGVSCFSRKLIESFVRAYNPEIIGYISTGNGKNPIYITNYGGVDIAVFMSFVGAPACITGYEEITSMGLEKLVVLGTCGVLDKDIGDLTVIIPTSAVRDEGTSYHYCPASEEIEVNKKYRVEFKKILKDHNYSYVEGKTWTTDAPYRETRDKVIKRKENGCVCVEMECSALAAVSQFREKDLFQFFYAADNLDSAKWDKRSLGCDDLLSDKEKILYLAFELAKEMNK